MGDESTSGSGESNETQVILNVYDLIPINNYTYLFGLGIFRSGIEVHGKEYRFGTHDFPVSGVFEGEPRNCSVFLYRNSIQLGKIKIPPSEFGHLLKIWLPNITEICITSYKKTVTISPMTISWRLTGRHVPGWVNRLARLDEDATESISNNTPKASPEVYDTDSEKHLLSPPSGSGEVVFVKEVRNDS